MDTPSHVGVPGLEEASWASAPREETPVPIRQIICKVASRCNLDCSYCYVYHSADQSWRTQPKRMGLDVARRLGERIREHGERHNLRDMRVVFHGGEPLLSGVSHLDALCAEIVKSAHPTQIGFGMQTNGVLFDSEALSLCLKWNVIVGLSLDGDQWANDRFRLDHRGRSSFAAVTKAAMCLSSEEGRRVWSGFLSVIDLRNDPVSTYRYLASFKPPTLEFLLPLANHENPPFRGNPEGDAPYADWLIRVFDDWYAKRPQSIQVIRFRDIISQLGGYSRSTEEWGLQPVDFVIVETDGALQAVDTLKTSFEGAADLGMNVFAHSLDDLAYSPRIRQRIDRASHLSESCRACGLLKTCGGGYFPHRYSKANQFLNPSVYCADLTKLIRHVHARVSADLAMLARQHG